MREEGRWKAYSDNGGASVIPEEVGGAGSDTMTPIHQDTGHSKSSVGSVYDAARAGSVGGEEDLWRENVLLPLGGA